MSLLRTFTAAALLASATPLFAALSTAFQDDFDATLSSAWKQNGEYKLAASDGELIVNCRKNTPWRSFAVEFADGARDFSAAPYVNVQLRVSRPLILHCYLVSGANNAMREVRVNALDSRGVVSFDFTGESGVDLSNITGLYFAFNGAGLALDADARFDWVRAGSAAQRLANIGAVNELVVDAAAASVSLRLMDLQQVASLQLETLDGDLVLDNPAFSAISSDGRATLSFKPQSAGEGFFRILAKAKPGFVDNSTDFQIFSQGEQPPTLDGIAPLDTAVGRDVELRLTGVSDGNSAKNQPLTITAEFDNPGIVGGYTVLHQPDSPYAHLYFTPANPGVCNVTVTVSDGTLSTQQSFQFTAHPIWNEAPSFETPAVADVFVGGEPTLVPLTGSDPEGAPLSFAVESLNPDLVIASVVSSGGVDTLQLTAASEQTGTAQVRVTLSDAGGNEENNGNASAVREIQVAVRPQLQFGQTITFTDLPGDLDAGRVVVEDSGVSQNASYTGGAVQLVLTDKSTWSGFWVQGLELDLRDNPTLSCEVWSDKAIQFHAYFWDNNGLRNAEAAHAQRKNIPANAWTSVSLDYSVAKGMETSEGVAINAERIQQVLFNYHPSFGWPFTNYSGTVRIRNVRIGDQAIVPNKTYTCTADGIANQFHLRTNSPEQASITLTGLGDGNPKAVNSVSAAAASSNSSWLPAPTVSAVSAGGTATLSYTPPKTVGTSTITVTVSANGSVNRTQTFTVRVVGDTTNSNKITLDPTQRFQTIHGFGTHENSELFTELYGRVLGASAVRIGLIGNTPEPVRNDNHDPYVIDYTKMNRDVLRWDYFRKLKEAGVETFILTSWGPPAWMKHNYSDDFMMAQAIDWESTQNKLDLDYYQEFAESMIALVRMMEQEAGITLYAIGLQNEPAFNEPYPSAILDPVRFANLVAVVGPRFAAEGITTKLYLPEQVFGQGFYSMNQYIDALRANTEANKYCKIIATHGYANDGIGAGQPDYSAWSGLWTYAQRGNPRELWMTETYPEYSGWNSALSYAGALHGSLTAGNISLWTSWNIEGQLISRGQPTDSFWTFRQFSRFVRPGAVRIAATTAQEDILASAYIHETDQTATVVLVNKGIQALVVDVDDPRLPATWERHVTQQYRYGEQMADHMGGKLVLPPSSVTTLVGSTAPETDNPFATVPNGQWKAVDGFGWCYGYTGSWVYQLQWGFLYTAAYPWIYDATAGYLYHVDGSLTAGGCVLFSPTHGYLWTSAAYGNWAYKYSTQSWIQL